MKKGIYIGLILLGLTVVSCNKQEILPNSCDDSAIPVWDSSDNRSPIDGDDNVDGSSNGSSNDIVDPNNPDDGVKKPKP